MLRAILISTILGILLLTANSKTMAQEVDEVLLTFSYPAVGQVYVSSVFRGDQPLIAFSEVLSILYIPFNRTQSGFGFSGEYNQAIKWEVDPLKFLIKINGNVISSNASNFYQGETDLYISPKFFKEIFDFELIVNPYGLMMSLNTLKPLPIDDIRKRESLRSKIKKNAPDNLLKDYPLLYPRKRALLGGGMLDYNLNMSQFSKSSSYNYSIAGGIEFLGGDIQGVFNGSVNSISTVNSFRASRWRYVFKNGIDPVEIPLISELSVGQINILSPNGSNIRGISISNVPIVPRRIFDLFAVDGYTTPDSEIELLISGQLVDFTRADELGYYRFTMPLTYGNTRISLRIYTPQGQVLFEERQLQIPFNFSPRGTLTYNAQVGFKDGFGNTDTSIAMHAAAIYGLTNNITLRLGATRGLDSTGTRISPYGSVSFRVMDQYLFNVDVLPEQFVRASGNVFFANNTSLNMQHISYTNYLNSNDVLKSDYRVNESNLNYYIPFIIFKKPLGLRLESRHVKFNTGNVFTSQSDINLRLGQIVTRLNYKYEFQNFPDSLATDNQLLTAAFTYTIPRNPGIPVFVRGMFFRAAISTDMRKINSSAFTTLQFSQTVFKKGRFTIGYGRDIVTGGNQLQLGFLYDFNAIRTSAQSNIRQDNNGYISSFSESFSGSLGVDLKNKAILPTNRDQVGRAAATIKLFVDDNANGKYDKGEEIIPAKAVKLDQSSNMYIGSDGFLRLTQLQNYWTYRLTVDPMELPDANLAPLKKKFSFVADPNRFKQIEIPLYRTGTIEGVVLRQRATGGRFEPQPGLRLKLHREGEEKDETPQEPLRTFADGTFYAYGLVPGNYTLLVDSGQLAFMGVQQEPDTLKFTIRALAEGDYIDTLEIRLVPRKADTTQTEEPPLTLAELERRLGDRLNKAVSGFIKAQENFYMGEYRLAYLQADSSLDYFYSDFALALKGSASYLIGKKQEAWQYWTDARERNPFIVLPDTSYLRSFTDTVTTGDRLARAPFNALDSLPMEKAVLIADFEVKLSESLRKAITSFVEAQELFYRKRFVEAGLMVDSSLNYQITDHGLALKGSIAYVQGRRNEAIQLWLEARERNPHIILPDLNVLDRLMQPVAENTRNANNARQLAP